MFELTRNLWPLLRDLYQNDRTNLTGYDLINAFLNWTDQSDSVKIFTTDKNWLQHGTFVLIHCFAEKTDVYLNTLNGSLGELQKLVFSLQLNDRTHFYGYSKRFKPIVDRYCEQTRASLKICEQLETYIYYLPKSAIDAFDYHPITDITFAPLDLKHAVVVNENWTHRSVESLDLIKSRIQNFINVGAFDSQGQLLAWCLRSSHGSLCNLHVLPSYRRLGLASLLVRHMAKEIAATGAEVLATIVLGNEVSQLFFEKLGFKPIGNLIFTLVPSAL